MAQPVTRITKDTQILGLIQFILGWLTGILTYLYFYPFQLGLSIAGVFIASGIVGIISGKKNTDIILITTFMVLSVISAFCSFILLIMCIRELGTYTLDIPHGVLLIISTAEEIVTIISAYLGCQVPYFERRQSPAAVQFRPTEQRCTSRRQITVISVADEPPSNYTHITGNITHIIEHTGTNINNNHINLTLLPAYETAVCNPPSYEFALPPPYRDIDPTPPPPYEELTQPVEETVTSS